MRISNLAVLTSLFAMLVFVPWALAQMDKPIFAEKPIGQAFQDFYFTGQDGKTSSLSDYRDKIVLIHVWATWCPPCVHEFPALLQAVRDNPNVQLIAISTDENKQNMDDFIDRYKKPGDTRMIFVSDPETIIANGRLDVHAYPETFVLAPGLLLNEHIDGPGNWAAWKAKP